MKDYKLYRSMQDIRKSHMETYHRALQSIPGLVGLQDAAVVLRYLLF